MARSEQLRSNDLVLAGFLSCLFLQIVSGSICCVPDQFEAVMFWDNGNVFIDASGRAPNMPMTAYSYINATVGAAYDYINKKAFMNITSVELTPLVPTPQKSQYVFLNDFAKGIQYQYTESHCEKSPLGKQTRQCIPDDAVRVSTGYIGNNEANVVTYTYTLPDSPFSFTATVDPKTCLPAYLTYLTPSSEADSGTLNNLQVGNVTNGIKDKSIYTPPKICLNATASNRRLKRGGLHKLVQDLSLSLPYFSIVYV